MCAERERAVARAANAEYTSCCVDREVEPGSRSWMDCLAAELFLTVVSVDTVTVFPTTAVPVDTVFVCFPQQSFLWTLSLCVLHNSRLCGHCLCVFSTTVVYVDTVFVTVFPTSRFCGHCLCDRVPHNSRFCGHCLCDCVPHKSVLRTLSL